MPAQLYRLHIDAPEAYSRTLRARYGDAGQKALLADVKRRVQTLGYTAPILATQDPTNGRRFTVLAYPRVGHDRGQTSDGTLKLLARVPVENPPTTVTRLPPAAGLDHGVTPDEASMVAYALRNERNPRHLNGIATTLEPYFLASASLLRAKADAIEKRVLMDPAASRALIQRALTLPVPSNLGTLIARLRTEQAKTSLPPLVLRDQAKNAIKSGLENPSALFASAPLGRMVRTLIQSLPDGSPIVTPQALAVAFPPSADDGFVSPSALQLALSAQKPEWSQVTDKTEIGAALRQIKARGTHGSPKEIHARHQLDRAERAIVRRRWVEWYRRRLAHGGLA